MYCLLSLQLIDCQKSAEPVDDHLVHFYFEEGIKNKLRGQALKKFKN